MKYYVSYSRNHIQRGMLVEAPAGKLAERYFQSREPHARFITAREATPGEISSGSPVLTVSPEEAASLRKAFLASHLEELDFSVRTYNCLRRAGIETIGDLVALSDDDLFKIRNLGIKCHEEIKRVLMQYGETLSEHSLFAPGKSAAGRLSDAIAKAEAKQKAAPTSSYMHESVFSVAHFADTAQMRDAILRSDELRHMTLDACYNIPGYLNLEREDQKQLYTLVQKALTTVFDRPRAAANHPEHEER